MVDETWLWHCDFCKKAVKREDAWIDYDRMVVCASCQKRQAMRERLEDYASAAQAMQRQAEALYRTAMHPMERADVVCT